jgi:hypothetical protein
MEWGMVVQHSLRGDGAWLCSASKACQGSLSLFIAKFMPAFLFTLYSVINILIFDIVRKRSTVPPENSNLEQILIQ